MMRVDFILDLRRPILFFNVIGSFPDDSNQLGFTAFLLTALSVLLILVTVPFSLCLVIKVSLK